MAETTEQTEGRLVFEPPGPGSWSLDKTHIARPATKVHHEIIPGPFNRAFGETFARFGIPAGGYDQALVGGFSYSQLTPLPPEDFEARIAAAEQAIAERIWRQDLQRWDGEVKAASIRRHLELAAVDPAGLDTDGLVDHVRVCAEHLGRMIAQHHEFNGATMVPLGDFLAHAIEWTGLPTASLLELFAGASPTSTGQCEELDAVRDALRRDPEAVELLRSDATAGAILDQLRTATLPATRRAVSDWIDLVGHRITDGFDVDQPCALEKPGVLVAALRRSVEVPAVRDVAAPLAAVRELVPAEHLDAFDDLYREAYDLYRLRDERGIYSDSPAFGLLRRAMLAAGERLVADGVLPEPALALEAGIDELTGLLAGAGTPDAAELAERRAFRHRWTVADAPSTLGDPPSPPPPYELLPPAMGRMTRAIVTFSGHMSATPPEAGDGRPRLVGLPASAGVHSGRAVVVHSIDDLERVDEGDVIVAITTAESFNLALSLASAVVTDQGGLLSHAAILAREYGIPAVVGTDDATRRIPEGAHVRVDGTTGEVTW
jgi:rifampicin phosphotransferase